MKKLFYAILISNLIFPVVMKADVLNDIEETNLSKIVAIEEKYYKTIVNNNTYFLYSLNNNSYQNSTTIEISKEEYDSFNENSFQPKTTVETTYKKMTTTISQNNSYYRYRVDLSWKNFPSKRSYDIIGIGFNSNVKVKNQLKYSTYYCRKDGSCNTITANYPQIFSNGAGTSFKLPEGELKELKTTLYFDVEKNTNSSITSQLASGDYSHATSNITVSQSKSYSVSVNGINLNGVSSYYDEINPAKANWYGNW